MRSSIKQAACSQDPLKVRRLHQISMNPSLEPGDVSFSFVPQAMVFPTCRAFCAHPACYSCRTPPEHEHQLSASFQRQFHCHRCQTQSWQRSLPKTTFQSQLKGLLRNWHFIICDWYQLVNFNPVVAGHTGTAHLDLHLRQTWPNSHGVHQNQRHLKATCV